MTEKHTVWAAAFLLSIAAIAWNVRLASIEQDKQEAFMMKACVDAGGSWSVDWRRNPTCARPEKSQ